MVDHKTRVIEPHEVLDKVDQLCERMNNMEKGYDRLAKDVAKLDTRTGSAPQRLVPRDTMYPPAAEEQLRLVAQTARDRLSKIEHLETELANHKTMLDQRDEGLTEKQNRVADYAKQLADAKAASGIKDEALAYVKEQRETLKEELTDANVKIGEVLLERDKYKAMAVDRLDTINILRAQLREAELKTNGKAKALANSERELHETKAALREHREAVDNLRQAHATACTEVSKLAAERDTLQQRLHVRKGKGHE